MTTLEQGTAARTARPTKIRWWVIVVLFVFYILVTWLSERAFEAIMRRVGKGILSEAHV